MQTSVLGNAVRVVLARCGLKVTRLNRMPIGADFLLDLQRYIPAEQILTIFDVGANVGQTAISFTKAYPNAAIYSFEHIVKTYDKLCANTKKYPSIHCNNFALGRVAGRATVHHQVKSGWNSLNGAINQPTNVGTSEEVDIKTISMFCRENKLRHIDILKTDTGGFDAEVLHGAGEMLSFGRTRFVFSEIGLDTKDKFHTSFFSLSEMLLTYNFTPVAIYDQKVSGELSRACYANVLFAFDSRGPTWVQHKP